jgi:hypothetical protein
MDQENSSKQANKQKKLGAKNSVEPKVLYALPGSYSVQNDTAKLKK